MSSQVSSRRDLQALRKAKAAGSITLIYPLILRKEDVPVALPQEVSLLSVMNLRFHECEEMFWERLLSLCKLSTLTVQVWKVELHFFCRAYRSCWQDSLMNLTLGFLPVKENFINIFGNL